MVVLQKWKKWWSCITRPWFLNKSWWIHFLTLLFRVSLYNSSLSLYKSTSLFLKKNERMTFILCQISDISPSEILLTMARRTFFTIGFLPRKQAAWNRLNSPWGRLSSLWRGPVSLNSGLSGTFSPLLRSGFAMASLRRAKDIPKLVLSETISL